MPDPPWTYATIFQLTLIGTADLVQFVNVLNFQASGTLEASMDTDVKAITESGKLADDWIANAKTTWLACHTNDYTMSLVKCQVIERPNRWRHKLVPTERPLTTANIGTAPVGGEALQVAANIKWKSTQAGKSTRGRSYLGPVPPNWTGNGMLTGTGLTNYGNHVTAMIARYAVGGTKATDWVLTIYSRPYNKGEYGYPIGKNPNREWFYPNEYAGKATDVVSGVVDPILRTQRRREVGVGS